MPIERTLARVDALIQAGDLPAARVRLRSLIEHDPRRLDVRARLAEVYRREGAVDEAGRWGYLDEGTTQPELRAFAKRFGGDPHRMLYQLRWQGPAEDAGSVLAAERLTGLREAASDAAGRLVEWREEPPAPSGSDRWWQIAAMWSVLAFLLASVVVGAVTIVRWLLGLVF
jgi:hypothetical protein